MKKKEGVRKCACCRSDIDIKKGVDGQRWCLRCLDVCCLYATEEERDRAHHRQKDFTPETVPEKAVDIVIKHLGMVASDDALRSMLADLLNVNNREVRRHAYADMARVLDLKILGLNIRTFNTLKKNNINTVWDLILRSRSDLYTMGGIGSRGETQINRNLSDMFGLSLARRPYNPHKSYMPRKRARNEL